MNYMSRPAKTDLGTLLRCKKAFSRLILRWFEKNRRDFPWRNTTDPYQILIAEIMLQRTRANQVAPVYQSFLREFPTIHDLYKANPRQIQKYFARLGLLWRAPLVKHMADAVVKGFNGRIPDDRTRLFSIPAVGEYVADAVLAFAFGQNAAIVDVNVCRVIGRVFGIEWRGEVRRKPMFKRILNKLLPSGEAKKFNWAIIDLASLVCTPKDPHCCKCPINQICEYAKANNRLMTS
jgi:A/G-specific adenine glycosylase